MELKAVASAFDKEVFQDYYSSSVTFYAQVYPFTESVRSGPTTVRRILSTAEDITVPTRRIIKHVDSGKVYIVGVGNEDYWSNEVIRRDYPLLPVDNQASIGTIANHLAASGLASDVFAAVNYVRRIPLEKETSLQYAGFECYFSSEETITKNSIILLSGEYYRSKINSIVDGAGFGMCEVELLEDPVTTATYTSISLDYDTENDSYPTTVTPGVNIFIEPAGLSYEFIYPAFVDVKEGDKAISVLKAEIATAKVGDSVGDRKVLAVKDKTDHWVLHCR